MVGRKIKGVKTGSFKGFCLRCQEEVTVPQGQKVTYKNKAKAVVGVCPHCGTKVSRFIKKRFY